MLLQRLHRFSQIALHPTSSSCWDPASRYIHTLPDLGSCRQPKGKKKKKAGLSSEAGLSLLWLLYNYSHWKPLWALYFTSYQYSQVCPSRPWGTRVRAAELELKRGPSILLLTDKKKKHTHLVLRSTLISLIKICWKHSSRCLCMSRMLSSAAGLTWWSREEDESWVWGHWIGQQVKSF